MIDLFGLCAVIRVFLSPNMGLAGVWFGVWICWRWKVKVVRRVERCWKVWVSVSGMIGLRHVWDDQVAAVIGTIIRHCVKGGMPFEYR